MQKGHGLVLLRHLSLLDCVKNWEQNDRIPHPLSQHPRDVDAHSERGFAARAGSARGARRGGRTRASSLPGAGSKSEAGRPAVSRVVCDSRRDPCGFRRRTPGGVDAASSSRRRRPRTLSRRGGRVVPDLWLGGMTFLGSVMPLGGTCTIGFPIFAVNKEVRAGKVARPETSFAVRQLGKLRGWPP